MVGFKFQVVKWYPMPASSYGDGQCIGNDPAWEGSGGLVKESFYAVIRRGSDPLHTLSLYYQCTIFS